MARRLPRHFRDRLHGSAASLAVGWGVLACGSLSTETPSTSSGTSVVVDPITCPTTLESGVGKVVHEAYLRDHAEQTQRVTVTLRAIQWTRPSCANLGSADCPDPDRALQERQALNSKQVECVLGAFSSPHFVGPVQAEWYETLRKLSTGVPVPIGVAFSTLALWPQLEVVAQHPYVERIEPAPGEAAKLSVAPAAIPQECPAPMDAPEPKLFDVASIQGQGRKPVILELNESALPALRSCPGEELCDERISSGWELTVASTRQLTCVRRFIDSALIAYAPRVASGSAQGLPTAPAVPPFGEGVHATSSWGLGLTWEEASQVAKHPDVRRIWTQDGLVFDEPPEGCPPDYNEPILTPKCSSEVEAIAAKFTAEAAAEWQASTLPNEVTIAVRRDQPRCPAPACPGDVTCPELELYLTYYEAVAAAAQHCVRSLIAAVGGVAADGLSSSVTLSATLTWPQIQTVAGYPDVASISPRFGPAHP